MCRNIAAPFYVYSCLKFDPTRGGAKNGEDSNSIKQFGPAANAFNLNTIIAE